MDAEPKFTAREIDRYSKNRRLNRLKLREETGIVDYAQAAPVVLKPLAPRYDWKLAEVLYFQKRKEDGTPYSLADVCAMCKPPIPLTSIQRRATKHKWHPRRKELLSLEQRAAREAKEQIFAAQGTVAAQRQVQRLVAEAAGVAAPDNQMDVLADLEQRYLKAVREASDETTAKNAMALGNLLKQARGVCTMPDGAPDPLEDMESPRGNLAEIEARIGAVRPGRELTGVLAQSEQYEVPE